MRLSNSVLKISWNSVFLRCSVFEVSRSNNLLLFCDKPQRQYTAKDTTLQMTSYTKFQLMRSNYKNGYLRNEVESFLFLMSHDFSGVQDWSLILPRPNPEEHHDPEGQHSQGKLILGFPEMQPHADHLNDPSLPQNHISRSWENSWNFGHGVFGGALFLEVLVTQYVVHRNSTKKIKSPYWKYLKINLRSYVKMVKM